MKPQPDYTEVLYWDVIYLDVKHIENERTSYRLIELLSDYGGVL